MSDALRSSLADALGLSPESAEALPVPRAPIENGYLRSRSFSRLVLPDEGEAGVGDIASARRRRDDRDLATPSALIRRASCEWPGQSAAVAALAVQLGVGKGEAWLRVINAGIDSLKMGEV